MNRINFQINESHKWADQLKEQENEFSIDYEVKSYDDASCMAPQQALEITLKSIISALWTHDDMLPIICAEVPECIEVEVDK